RPVPFGEMEAGGEVLVNAREVPVAEEFSDVREFIAEPREVDADLAQLAQDAGVAATAARAQVPIRALQRMIQDAIVSLQFRQLQIGQLHDVKRLVKVLPLINQE